MKATFITLFLTGLAWGQPISVGVKGGVPLTDFVETFRGNSASYVTNTKRYTVGPTVEFRLPARFSIEVDALYKRFGFDSQSTAGQQTALTRTRGNSWEFPILAKFEILPGPIRPFVNAGISIRHLSGIKQVRSVVSGVTFNQVEINNPAEFNKETDLGFAFGGGIAFKAGRLRISPELRYTRWGSENLRDPINSLLRTNRNQADFLLGITF